MKKRIFAMLLALTMALALAACQPGGESADPVDAPMLADFSNGPVEAFFASDGWSNGSVFNVWWKGDTVTYTDGQLHLGIADAKGEAEQDYSAARPAPACTTATATTSSA